MFKLLLLVLAVHEAVAADKLFVNKCNDKCSNDDQVGYLNIRDIMKIKGVKGMKGGPGIAGELETCTCGIETEYVKQQV